MKHAGEIKRPSKIRPTKRFFLRAAKRDRSTLLPFTSSVVQDGRWVFGRTSSVVRTCQKTLEALHPRNGRCAADMMTQKAVRDAGALVHSALHVRVCG
jgi:hypothetical protein